MTKYYRVRTQEQWDWLRNKLEFYGLGYTPKFPETVMYDKDNGFCGIYRFERDLGNIIEVSDLMGDEKMEDCVTIKGKDVEKLKNEAGDSLFYTQDEYHFSFSFMEDYGCSEIRIPKSLIYPKITMTVAEKAEFDELVADDYVRTPYDVFVKVSDDDRFQHLAKKLFVLNAVKQTQAQIEFARAWADPSLIEVVKEPKFNVKVPVSKGRDYYEKYSTVKEDNLVIVGTLNSLRELLTNTEFQFTDDELKKYGLDDDMYEKVEVQE